MLLDTIFGNFVKRKAYCVMARAALQRMLKASHLDELFRQFASVQYERELLFSQLVEVMARVVTRVDRSVLRAVVALRDVLTVTDEAIYQKLRGVETTVSQALVRDSFRQASAVLEKMDVPINRGWVVFASRSLMGIIWQRHNIGSLNCERSGMLPCLVPLWWFGIR